MNRPDRTERKKHRSGIGMPRAMLCVAVIGAILMICSGCRTDAAAPASSVPWQEPSDTAVREIQSEEPTVSESETASTAPTVSREESKLPPAVPQPPAKIDRIRLVYSHKENRLRVYSVAGDTQTELFRSVAYCGENGVSDHKQEGDLCTPAGTYSIYRCFGIEKPPTELENFITVSDSTYWVDDPDSRYYNRCVDGNSVEKDWKSAEHMIECRDMYAYGLVIEYNTDPVVKGKGSAIFLHCGAETTKGCLCVPKDVIIRLMELLKDYPMSITIE